ncbi:MAG: cytochrome P450 [Gammaproteobacteria bacterium]
MAKPTWNAILERLLTLLGAFVRAIGGKLSELLKPGTPPAEPAPMPPPIRVPSAQTFLGDIAAAEQAAPVPPLPLPPPTSDDPKYAGNPALFEQDKKAAEQAAAAFATAAKARGAAVAGVISKWLATSPLMMLQELLYQPKDKMPIFKPAIGPVVVMRHADVIKCLERTDLFTVDPYAPEMARATDDKAKSPHALSHFMLGTDRDELYRLVDVILRRAVSRRDKETLSALARREAEQWTEATRKAGTGEVDIVTTLAKFLPLRIVADYLGVPYYRDGEPSVLPGLCGGDRFALDPDLQQVFTFTEIQEGIVPRADDLFNWVKDAFRNIFNNFNPVHPQFAEFRARGLSATEYLGTYIHALVKHYKERLQRGDKVPDTMLTRLIRMQLEVAAGTGTALEQDLATLLGAPPPPGELARRLSDSMIRSNVFGTAVGAVVNPQEATARIVDSMLRLKEGQYEILNGSTFEEAQRLARIEEGDPDYAHSLPILRKYALEAMRLQPQGEVLLRVCVQDNSELGGTLIRKGTMVFAAYAAAMRDPDVLPHPLAFDAYRDERPVAYLGERERANEAPQSQNYLQHGYGRHKCLGRYASEITMRESLRALLRLGQLARRSELKMDEQNLYPEGLRVGFT